MNNPFPNSIPTPPAPSWIERRCSGSNFLFALGIVLLCFGQAITGDHRVTMIGLGMVVFSSIFEW
ncbi:MAG: hypothetical protein ACLGXA_09070 [Acidobacteriota bacterium]